MIRPLTCLCMLLAGGSGLYLYQEKHRTSLLDREITRTIRASEAAHERTGLLRAEWALLNEPGRLRDLADRFLSLHAVSPSQFVPAGELAQRLPAVAAPGAPGAIDREPATVAEARAAAPVVDGPPAPARVEVARVAAARPEAPRLGVAVASAAEGARAEVAPRPAAVARVAAEGKAVEPKAAEPKVAAVVPRPARPAPARVYASVVPPAVPMPATPMPAGGGGYAGAHVMAPVLAALATPVAPRAPRPEPVVTRAAAVMPVRPVATPSVPAAPVPYPGGASYSGSSLGTGRASLPPPVPMGAGAQ